MDISDGMDKSWNHAWTTEEMRTKRREWSLAADAGLLKHLEQFSENLVSRANKTEETLNSLTTQLNEAAILIDNVTNTSLALSNNQFIESRVQEDDIEIEKKETLAQESKNEDLATADLIASVSESIKEGLNIMDQKYKKMEFLDSDSEEEDNGVVLRVVLGPNDPYQHRPLPYVIGSDLWKKSTKIGLESSSSSSESEQVEEEEESRSDNDTATLRGYNIDTGPKPNIVGLSPSLIESDYSRRSDITYTDNDKLDVVSQNNMHSASESISPNDNTPKVPLSNDSTPNFAEELAKRLGTVRQAEKPVIVDEKSEASINRLKDDLFTPDGHENALNDKSKSIFNESEFLNDQASESLWKEKPIKSYKNNIIPASLDVPPPISTVSTQPKSAIDDLFGDGDSEDSDDIFSPKNTVKTVAKTKHPNNSNVNTEIAQKKFLDTVAPSVISNRATSTPETNANNSNLFSDDDEDDLFGSFKNPVSNKKGVENKLSNRIIRTKSSESSGSDPSAANQESVQDNLRNTHSNDNNATDRSSIVMARNNAENLTATNESTNTSGISIQPPSINITGCSSIRVASDSLFTARSPNPVNATANSNLTSNQPQEEPTEESISTQEDDVFENEDLFGPPPLPKADTKPVKSKVSFLFDDSDSGDELFSTTSSGSRSQKSTDFLTAAGTQYSDKAKVTQRKGLFDEDIDVFGSKDSPDVDIFGIAAFKSVQEETNVPGKRPSDTTDDGLFARTIKDTMSKKNDVDKQSSNMPKKISLFDDDEDNDDGDLFAAKPISNESKTESQLLNNEGDGDLFLIKKTNDAKQTNVKQSVGTGSAGKDSVEQESVRKTENKSGGILSGNGLFPDTVSSHGSIFEDDDYFSRSNVTKEEKKQDEKATPQSNIVTDIVSVMGTEVTVGSNTFDDNKKIDTFEKGESRTTYEEPAAVETAETEPKKSPPRSLDIQTTVSSSSSNENDQAARRTVSGKIKNLMGKMGDLKILSPMDTPPLWRRSEEKTDEDDSITDRDSDDGGCISTQGHSSPPSVSEDSTAQKQSLQSTVSGESNVESAISFDEPAQVETLSTAASKTRVRIQAKRRPQSRHARKTALRHSGIDFDTVDASGSNPPNESYGDNLSGGLAKDPSNPANSNIPQIANSERLVTTGNDGFHRLIDPNVSLATDDRSELGSISKESSMSANKNTLLSPSTDEEDLFDVPPDLPEDPQKEDALFGRAPILSPVDRVLSEKPVPGLKPLKDTHIKTVDNNTGVTVEKSKAINQSRKPTEANNEYGTRATVPSENENDNDDVHSKEMIDPLRDNKHDPLKDPSQLFAFVTKTPSPEKGKNLLFSEDDSLFSSGAKRPSEDQTAKKSVLDLFADDAEGDLFSATLSKPVKKSMKDTKISLFDDDDGPDDEEDSLFGPVTKKSAAGAEIERKRSTQQPHKKISLFDDGNDDASLFSEKSEHAQKSDAGSVQEPQNKNEILASTTDPVKTSHITDIFGDQSSGEDDIFAAKTILKKVVTTKSLFPSNDDDDDSDIFGKKSSTSELRAQPTETRATVKKSVTRDLRKTAEKIGEDPLSILQDD
ncbi:PREDICTED: WASH complex subunit FAM21 [Dufourea novaeangliae]|uniref:WASH complex subunit FAM21 n=1 Tax=Dufourea novaeangliae TaxID=178035 RepID=UPI0007677072|nr:PREDICTED: WASH complex subunit FAM21 [Dufourea novaeangliae]